MASVIRQKTSKGIRYSIQLSSGENTARPKIALGKVTKRQAETAKINIENLLKCKDTGDVMSPAVQDWLSRISDGLHKRLEALSITERNSNTLNLTIAKLTGKYISSRPDVKEPTKRKWRDVQRKLIAFFRDSDIEDITVSQAKAFRTYLSTTVGLSENSIRRQIGIARQFFNAAIDSGIITKNPFRGQSVCVRANPARMFYVTPEMAHQALNVCPDAQWRLIFGLARWGGLRCPSEVLRLKWEDIDFEYDRFTVHASKTEHHADSGIRTVPMFTELKPLFQDAFDMAKTGDTYCITEYREGANLRTQMARIIKKAGLEPWPKIFQNLRSTRETELFKLTNGNIKAVCSWIGNSPAVAMQHYAQVTEADLQEAAKLAVINEAEKRVQNPVQTTAELPRKESQELKNTTAVSPCYCESNNKKAALCETMQNAAEWAVQDSNL